MRELLKLVYWIKEREKVRLAKEAGYSRPWSDSPIFQKTYFCNVHREDDKTTRWIRTYWNFPAHPRYELAICLARMINKIETLQDLPRPDMGGWTIGNTIDLLRTFAGEGRTIWNSAYIVSTNGKKMDKLTWLEEFLLQLHDIYKVRNCQTLAEAHQFLMIYDGLGSFMAAQIVADLKNTTGHPLSQVSDWWTWSSYGPGSLRGLQWLYGHKVMPTMYDLYIKEVHREVEGLIHPIVVCEQDLQNCLCEFDKMMRVLTNTGRSKRIYHGKATGYDND